jgi:hypothetical protein
MAIKAFFIFFTSWKLLKFYHSRGKKAMCIKWKAGNRPVTMLCSSAGNVRNYWSLDGITVENRCK